METVTEKDLILALSHATVENTVNDGMTTEEIKTALNITQYALGKRLKILSQLGIITPTKQKRWATAISGDGRRVPAYQIQEGLDVDSVLPLLDKRDHNGIKKLIESLNGNMR